MKEYKIPQIEEEDIELEDVMAVSLGDGTDFDSDPFFSDESIGL